MAGTFKNAQTGQAYPLLQVHPFFTAVADLPPAASFPGRIVGLQTSTSPNAPCLAISDGTNWYPISIGGTAIS